MQQANYRNWKVYCEEAGRHLLIGDVFCPLLEKFANAHEPDLFDDAGDVSNASSDSRSRKKTSPMRMPKSSVLVRKPLLFKYDKEWLESGFSLGADLPLSAAIMKPALGRANFGFLEDRALDSSTAVWFDEASSFGAKGTQTAPDATDQEIRSILLPHRHAHAGALAFENAQGNVAGNALPIPQESKGIDPLIYAVHAAERGRGKLKTLLELAGSCALPGKHSSQVLISGRDEYVLTVKRISDTFDVPLWREVYVELARNAGIDCPETKLIDTMGSRGLLTSRVDRDDGKPVFMLSANALAGPKASYLALADILNREGAAPGIDLPQAWKRMVFAFLTGAGDAPRKWLFRREEFGWRLAKAHGWAPDAGLARPMTADGWKPLSSAEDAVRLAPYFGMKIADAKRELIVIRKAAAGWEDLALSLGALPEEIAEAEPGFCAY